MELRLLLTGFLITLFACAPDRNNDIPAAAQGKKITLEYAAGFEIGYLEDGIYRVDVKRPFKKAGDTLTYFLVPEGEDFQAPSEAAIIRTPVRRIICTSTTHIPLLDYLGETDALVGFPTPEYISSPTMRRHIASGKVADLGVDKSMNTELALALDPDVVMAYSISGNNAVNQKLTELGVPVLINAEYLEEHPLGRAEWIKLAGLLFDKFEESDSIFRAIEKSYLDYASLLNPGDHRPTAFSGVLYGDTWFLPGGKNYASRIMDDAGIEYLWGNNPESGFLEISFESVLNKAKDADLWIGVAQFRSRSAMRKGDERYNLFSAFRDGQVYTYSSTPSGTGSPYLELGYLRPDLILSDLIQIAHPDKISNGSMRFYSKLDP